MSSSSGRYVYEAPWQAYSLAWAVRNDPRHRFAIGSFCEQEKNMVQVVEMNQETQVLEKIAEIEQPFPQTKMMWKPTEGCLSATASDFDGGLLAMSAVEIEFHRLQDGKLKLAHKLKCLRKDTGKAPAPLTSFDWCPHNEAKLGTSSVDTTCSIFDLERMKVETQLIAHDKAVHDFAFGVGWGSIFASVGADGSLRIFDQRNLAVSTIFYETQHATPLYRLAWNKLDQNYLAVVTEASGIAILDMRRPSCAVLDSASLGLNANCIAWAGTSRQHLVWGTDCGKALIWDITQGPESMLTYETNHEVYQVHWPDSVPDQIALGTANSFEVVST